MDVRRLLVLAPVALSLVAFPSSASAKAKDRDRDGMPDTWERAHKLNVGAKDGALDPDHDGLTNLGEYRSRTEPRDADTDGDRTEDGDEDRDRDGVDNANEVQEGTSPTDRDSDDDGTGDGAEDRDRDGLRNAAEDVSGNDPTDADTDDDGTRDGREETGVIASLAGDVLTITLPDGSTISGRVSADTEVECKTEDEHEDTNRKADGESPRAVRSSDDGHDDAPEPASETEDAPKSASASEDRDEDGRDDSSPSERPGSKSEDRGDEDNVCTTADLVAGMRVHEAEVETTADGAVFKKVEILK